MNAKQTILLIRGKEVVVIRWTLLSPRPILGLPMLFMNDYDPSTTLSHHAQVVPIPLWPTDRVVGFFALAWKIVVPVQNLRTA